MPVIETQYTEHLAPDVILYLGTEQGYGTWYVKLGGSVVFPWIELFVAVGETPRAAGRRIALDEIQRQKRVLEEELARINQAVIALSKKEPAPWDIPMSG